MTNGELREQLRRIIWETTGVMNAEAYAAAESIIEELGLTVEEAHDTDNRTKRNGIVHYGVKTRVVGKWEEEK